MNENTKIFLGQLESLNKIHFLTVDEKKIIRQNLITFIDAALPEKEGVYGREQAVEQNDPMVLKLPRQRRRINLTTESFIKSVLSFLNIFSWARPLAVGIVVVAVFLVGIGTSFAAEQSLPGQSLYAVKLEVNERVQGWLAVTPSAKARWQAQRISRRLQEGEELKQQGRLNAQVEAQLQMLIRENSSEFNHYTTEIARAGREIEASDLTAQLKDSLQAHQTILQEINATVLANNLKNEVEPKSAGPISNSSTLVVVVPEVFEKTNLSRGDVFGTATLADRLRFNGNQFFELISPRIQPADQFTDSSGEDERLPSVTALLDTEASIAGPSLNSSLISTTARVSSSDNILPVTPSTTVRSTDSLISTNSTANVAPFVPAVSSSSTPPYSPRFDSATTSASAYLPSSSLIASAPASSSTVTSPPVSPSTNATTTSSQITATTSANSSNGSGTAISSTSSNKAP